MGGSEPESSAAQHIFSVLGTVSHYNGEGDIVVPFYRISRFAGVSAEAFTPAMGGLLGRANRRSGVASVGVARYTGNCVALHG